MEPRILLLSIALLGWWGFVLRLQCMIAAFALAQGRWRVALFSLVSLAAAALLVSAARVLVDLRPDVFERFGVLLPSGHSALVVVVVASLAALVRQGRPLLRLSLACGTVLAVAGVMAAWTAHTVGDVVVGMALGVAAVHASRIVARRRRLLPRFRTRARVVSGSATGPASPAR